MHVSRYETPLEEPLAFELHDLWKSTFRSMPSSHFDDLLKILSGAEVAHNRNLIYLTRENDKLVGTTHLTRSRSAPALGGLGEVVTHPEFRRSGIATRLCAEARDDFQASGSQALFLGTVGLNAARVYRRLGWRRMPSTIVYANIGGGQTPEAFLLSYFKQRSETAISPGTAANRLTMIPLLSAPHDWLVLDANIGLFSTRYAELTGCMSLYPRFVALGLDGRGSWFAADTGDGRLVGLSTAKLDGEGRCQVDGFAHGSFVESWNNLIDAATGWGLAHGATSCWADVCVEDEDKVALFEGLGFRKSGPAGGFDIDGREVESVRLEQAAGQSRQV